MKFYYVYILHNPKKNFIYIGYSENLIKRFKQHNSGESKSTKAYRPFKLIHYEAYHSKKDAKRREEYLKTNHGRTTLITMLKEYFVSEEIILKSKIFLTDDELKKTRQSFAEEWPKRS